MAVLVPLLELGFVLMPWLVPVLVLFVPVPAPVFVVFVIVLCPCAVCACVRAFALFNLPSLVF